MSNMKYFMAFLLLFSISFSFTIDSYNSDVQVQGNGDLLVHETMVFTLEEAYSEGYRSIRPQDFDSDLNNIVIHSVTVNGQNVEYVKQMNGENAEIVWKKTFQGINTVELSYTLKDRVELWDDYAKVCFEHYGAQWSAPATTFYSKMTMPEAARGKTLHFEIYSTKEGDAHIEDLSVITQMNNVPSGNYIGGCYLFDKSAVSTNKVMNGSAYAILKNEREAYGSKSLLNPADNFPCAPCCCPFGVLLLVIAAYLAYQQFGQKKLPESIMPPSNEEPVVVATIINNNYDESNILASTILELINKGVIDIMELEKAGEKGMEIKRERTILFLKKRPDTLKPYELAVIDMIFQEGKKEVDLDALAAEFDKIKGKEDAKKSIIPEKMDLFSAEITKILKEKNLSGVAGKKMQKRGIVGGLGFPLFFFGLCFVASFAVGGFDFLGFLWETGDYLYLIAILAGTFLVIGAAPAIIFLFLQPEVPKGFETQYAQWDGFARAVKASTLKTQPPSSALIWGEILVYANALGLADKVKKHLSELDSLIAKRVEKMDHVRRRTHIFYASALGVRNLSKYGYRSGSGGGHGGFSSHSSGGWSSGGGGGFSGGHSGGGGFR
jgi:uncharacterized membrane protein